ncbi:MAG: gliding motility-associated protein GldE [Bacteroidetes bacterium]|nr:gliding motility-associated protein GldE [Bacteroidota bacterium]
MEPPSNGLFIVSYLLFHFLAVVPQGVTFLVIVLVLLLLLSFVIAGNEAALFSLSKRDIDVLKTKQHESARRIVQLLSVPKQLYATLLMAGTFVNICSILLANYLILPLFPAGWLAVLVRILLLVFLVFFTTRILPKIWGTQHNLRFAHDWSFVAAGLHALLFGLSNWLVKLADQIARTTGANRSQEISKQELDDAIEFKSDQEASVAEKNIMRGVVKFGGIAVKQIMRSRLDVSGVDYQLSFPDLLQRVQELHYSRLPVYKGSLDEVVGILYTKDLLPCLEAPANFDWHKLLQAPYFVPEPKLIEDLLKTFQQRRIHFAVVVDEFGGTSGIVTMEDILEEVIGDIRDEFDEEEAMGQQLDDHTYLFEGKILLTDLCRALSVPTDTFEEVKGDSDSLAGLLLERVGALPAKDQVIVFGDFEFKVLEIEQNRIQRVQVSTHYPSL